MKRGFTIIELLLVIGVIGILMAVMLGSLGGASKSARAAKCLSNLHNLASACQTYAMEHSYYPTAGSSEIRTRQSAKKSTYSESKGWISWTSMNAYKNGPTASKAGSGWFMSTYGGSIEQRIYSLTNGAIWQAISGNAESYKCPMHLSYAKKKKVEPVWSYVMNSYFGWDKSMGSIPQLSYDSGAKAFSKLSKPDRRLMLAELPYNTDNMAQNCKFSTGTGIDLDPTLQYEKNEYIGFNHKDGKKWYAHVCFADGHTEKLELPKGASEAAMRELTKFLCLGTDVAYNGSKYEELK